MGAVVRLLLIWLALSVPSRALAAPDAAFVMDARTGQVLLAENADTPLHPASLTKMMTLHVAFAAIERGEIGLDTTVRVSARAAATGGASLGLGTGQEIPVRHLVRAVAVRSANDAAVALAEAVGGTEEEFVARMNEAAAAMALDGTRFRNAHGLTAEGHLSTARDMSVLGRRLLLEFPAYAGLYARQVAEIGPRRIAHTNRRFLSGYAGADGIKTGYTRAAGYTLTASATRGGKHLIVTVFGAPSSAARAARAARLLDRGFAQVAEDVVHVPPAPLARPQAAPVGLLAGARPLLDGSARPLSGDLPPRDGPGPSAPVPPGGLALSGLAPFRGGAPPDAEGLRLDAF